MAQKSVEARELTWGSEFRHDEMSANKISKVRRILVASVALCLLALAGVGALVVAEAIYRGTGANQIARKGYIIDVNLFQYRPYVVSAMQPNLRLGNSKSVLEKYFKEKDCRLPDGTTAIFNSLGFRSPEFTNLPPKKPDEIRIIITGGSAAMSWNVNEECTLDRNLKKLLEAAVPGSDIRIFNLANAAWISFQELIAIQLFGLAIDPDVVLSFSGFNDFQHAFYSPADRAYAAGHMENAFRDYKAEIEAGPGDLLRHFTLAELPKRLFETRRSPTEMAGKKKQFPDRADRAEPGYLATRLRLPLDVDAIEKRSDFDPYNQSVVDGFVRNQKLMARSIATVGGTLISILQPTLYLKRYLEAGEKEKLVEQYQHDVNFVVQAYLRARRLLRRVSGSNESNQKFIDLSMIFGSRADQIFTDNVHMNPEGYRVAASRLAPVILDIISKSKSDR